MRFVVAKSEVDFLISKLPVEENVEGWQPYCMALNHLHNLGFIVRNRRTYGNYIAFRKGSLVLGKWDKTSRRYIVFDFIGNQLTLMRKKYLFPVEAVDVPYPELRWPVARVTSQESDEFLMGMVSKGAKLAENCSDFDLSWSRGISASLHIPDDYNRRSYVKKGELVLYRMRLNRPTSVDVASLNVDRVYSMRATHLFEVERV